MYINVYMCIYLWAWTCHTGFRSFDKMHISAVQSGVGGKAQKLLCVSFEKRKGARRREEPTETEETRGLKKRMHRFRP